MDSYDQACNAKLLAHIPESKKILELGCADGLLGWNYKQKFPAAIWHGVDLPGEILALASTRIDQTYSIDPDRQSLSDAGNGYDCVVLGNVLERLVDPVKLLSDLQSITTADARIICCISNMGHASIIKKMISGDLSYDKQGLPNQSQLHFFTKSSIIKLLLDCAWNPNILERYHVDDQDQAFIQHLSAAARALRISPKAAMRNFTTSAYVIDCIKINKKNHLQRPALSVIVAVNDDNQLGLNVLRSPGLTEINAEIILSRNAKSAADAFEQGKAKASGEWLIFCHQDVYFPQGFGDSLFDAMENMPARSLQKGVIGFAGLALDASGDVVQAGALIDRGRRFDHQPSERMISLDEFAIAFHKNCELRIDPALGWHLWATDLCLQGVFDRDGACFSISVSDSIFHNSYSFFRNADGEYTLPADFHHSAQVLSGKYPGMKLIPTLCGTIQSGQLI